MSSPYEQDDSNGADDLPRDPAEIERAENYRLSVEMTRIGKKDGKMVDYVDEVQKRYTMPGKEKKGGSDKRKARAEEAAKQSSADQAPAKEPPKAKEAPKKEPKRKVAATPVRKTRAQKKAAAEEQDEELEGEASKKEPVQKAKPKTKAPQKKTTPAAAEQEDDGDDDDDDDDDDDANARAEATLQMRKTITNLLKNSVQVYHQFVEYTTAFDSAAAGDEAEKELANALGKRPRTKKQREAESGPAAKKTKK